MPQYPLLQFVKPSNLPKNGIILNESPTIYDMDGKVHVAYRIKWVEIDQEDFGLHYSWFDTTTGEYLGEA
jgi:hypothetical protein